MTRRTAQPVGPATRVVGYARFHKDDGGGFHASVANQLSRLSEASDQPGTPPPATAFYDDHESSGYAPWEDRGGLRQLIHDAGTGAFDVVRVLSMFVLSPSRADVFDIMDRLKELGVEVFSDDASPKSPFGLPVYMLMAQAAREERRFLADQAAEGQPTDA